MTEANNTSADYLVALGKVQRFPRKEIELCILKKFLNPDECSRLITMIDQKRRPSDIADPNGDDYFRTSETCDLDHSDPFVADIDAKICNFADIRCRVSVTQLVRNSKRTRIFLIRMVRISGNIARYRDSEAGPS